MADHVGVLWRIAAVVAAGLVMTVGGVAPAGRPAAVAFAAAPSAAVDPGPVAGVVEGVIGAAQDVIDAGGLPPAPVLRWPAPPGVLQPPGAGGGPPGTGPPASGQPAGHPPEPDPAPGVHADPVTPDARPGDRGGASRPAERRAAPSPAAPAGPAAGEGLTTRTVSTTARTYWLPLAVAALLLALSAGAGLSAGDRRLAEAVADEGERVPFR